MLRIGVKSYSNSPTGDFDRTLPIMISPGAVSTVERPNARTTIAIIGNAGRDSIPVMQLRFPSPVSIGNATVLHELNVSPCHPAASDRNSPSLTRRRISRCSGRAS